MVFSVPHSGTRSLLRYLGFTGINHRTNSLHFGYDDKAINAYKGLIQIPLRPLADIVSSHLARGLGETFPFKSYELLLEYVKNTSNRVKLYPIEGLKGIRLGHKPKDEKFVEKAHKLVDEWLTINSNQAKVETLLADPRVVKIK